MGPPRFRWLTGKSVTSIIFGAIATRLLLWFWFLIISGKEREKSEKLTLMAHFDNSVEKNFDENLTSYFNNGDSEIPQPMLGCGWQWRCDHCCSSQNTWKHCLAKPSRPRNRNIHVSLTTRHFQTTSMSNRKIYQIRKFYRQILLKSRHYNYFLPFFSFPFKLNPLNLQSQRVPSSWPLIMTDTLAGCFFNFFFFRHVTKYPVP